MLDRSSKQSGIHTCYSVFVGLLFFSVESVSFLQTVFCSCILYLFLCTAVGDSSSVEGELEVTESSRPRVTRSKMRKPKDVVEIVDSPARLTKR